MDKRNENFAHVTRIYNSQYLNIGSEINISDKDLIHYILNVMRLNISDEIRIFNEQNGEFLGKIINLNKKNIVIEIIELLRNASKSPNKSIITIFVAPIKQQRWKNLIEKITEIGVDFIQPIITERTINRNVNDTKLQKIIIEAAEQCERITLPKVNNIKKLNEVDFTNYDKIFFCNEKEKYCPMINSIAKIEGDSKFGIIIGPEGGFTSQENHLLNNFQNIESVNIGHNILRTDTAAVVSVNLLRTWLDNKLISN